MAASIVPFNRLQVGMSVIGTKGTAVPATRQLVGDHTLTEEGDMYRSQYPAGVRANLGGAGTFLRKGTAIDYNSDMTAEEILWFLQTGIKGGITPSTVDTNAKLWTFTPELTTAVTTIDTMTAEMARGDGTTNHYYGECAYVMTESFKLDWAFNQIGKLTAKLFGRARQTDTLTAAIVPYPTREPLASNQLAVYWDTAWANLGNTALAGLVRSASLDVSTGYAPDYVLDGRTDVDFGLHKVGPLSAKLSITMEFDSVGAAKFALWRSNSLVYIRLHTTGSLIGAVSALKFIRVDGAYRFVSAPVFSNDGDQVLCSFELESFYDTTGTKTLEFSAQNALAAIA